MNILCFSNQTGSVQWRLKGPANYINARTNHEMFVTSASNWHEEILGADVVVAQMWQNPKGIYYCQQQGAKVVYEADDIILNVGGKERKNLMTLTQKQEEMTIETIKAADMVTVTTNVLAEHYKQFNDNVVILPNYMDFMWWGQPQLVEKPNQVAWAGWAQTPTGKTCCLSSP
jgi:hypothetical protein